MFGSTCLRRNMRGECSTVICSWTGFRNPRKQEKGRSRAMASLAVSLVESVADEQAARNSCFPDGATSPVIGLLLMSVTAAMDHLPLCGDKPLRALSLTLVQMMLMLGPMASETTAALAEGDFAWTEGTEHPTQQEAQRVLDELQSEMELATRWFNGGCKRQEKPGSEQTGGSMLLSLPSRRCATMTHLQGPDSEELLLPIAYAGCLGGTQPGFIADGDDGWTAAPVT